MVPCFLEKHTEAVERHRFLDAAFDHQLVGDLGGGHELTITGSRDVKIDGEELLLVLLRTEIIVMRLQLIDVMEVKPILESVINQVFCLRIYLLVRERYIERVTDTLGQKRDAKTTP